MHKNFIADLSNAKDERLVENVRIKYLGRKDELSSYFSLMEKVSNEQKAKLGRALNNLKSFFQDQLKQISEKLESTNKKQDFFDVSLAGVSVPLGTKHILNIVLDDIKNIFSSFGFAIETGPELETDYYNFEALNMPKDHPSRTCRILFIYAMILC